MQKILQNLSKWSVRLDRRYIQLAYIVIITGMLVIGAGAPEDGGSSNCVNCPG